jgi:hypothetical protein
MNEQHEHSDGFDRTMGLALEDLAATMPDDQGILDGVYTRVGRLKRRRRTVRVVAGAAVCALTVAGLAVLRSATTTNVNTPASTPVTAAAGTTVTTAVSTPCTGMSAAQLEAAASGGSQASEQKKAAGAQADTQAAALKKAAAARASRAGAGADTSATPSGADRQKQAAAAGANDTSMVKLTGHVVGTPTGDTFKVKPVESSGPTNELEIAISATTTFLANGHASARPHLVSGQLVAVAAHAAGSAYVADIIDSRPGNPQAPAPPQDVLQGKALTKVMARNGSVFTLQPVAPGLGVTTLTVDLSTIHPHHSNGTGCSSVNLAVGQGVGVMVVRDTQHAPWKVLDVVFP